MSVRTLNMCEASVPGTADRARSCISVDARVRHAQCNAWRKQSPGLGKPVQKWPRRASGHGAVLFRGLPLNSPEDCDAFVAAFGLTNFPYKESLSNAVRVN